jgi:hypothetical protein
MASQIIKLFNTVKQYGETVRNNSLDGLESWNKIKSIIKVVDSDSKLNGWAINIKINGKKTNNLKEIFDYVHDELKMYGDEDDDKKYKTGHKEWERYHFFLQLIRIPHLNSCSLIRLCQVAYNIGQYRSENNKKAYPQECQDYFELNNLDKIESYISLDDVSYDFTKIIEQIKSEKDKISVGLSGGNMSYYHKYLKYKNKYFELKKIL